MRIKVKINSNLSIKNVFEPPLEMEMEVGENALQDVLQKLTDLFQPLQFIERGEMGDDLRNIYLNDESHFSFSEGLKREIKEGDTIMVEAYMDPLAGG